MSLTPRWQPILDGAEAKQAIDNAQGILRDVRRSLPATAESSPSLASGTVGAALLYHYAALAFPGDELRDLATSYRDAAVESVQHRDVDLSLFAGLTGLAWLDEHLSQPGDDDPNDELDELLRSALATRWDGHYDVVFGLVGHGVYACERAARGRDAPLELVCTRLVELAEPSGTWFTRRELLPETQLAGPDGYFNLGLAHGVPGAIAMLANGVRAGCAPRSTLAAATRWLISRGAPLSATRSSMYGFVDDPAHAHARAAWCYGDPGVGIALLAAADALGDPEVERYAIEVLLAAASRSKASAEVEDAGLCHGAAGLALIFARAANATGEPRLLEAAQRWARELLLSDPPADPGFLTGAIGVGLALLALATPIAPAWDRCLLLSSN